MLEITFRSALIFLYAFLGYFQASKILSLPRTPTSVQCFSICIEHLSICIFTLIMSSVTIYHILCLITKTYCIWCWKRIAVPHLLSLCGCVRSWCSGCWAALRSKASLTDQWECPGTKPSQQLLPKPQQNPAKTPCSVFRQPSVRRVWVDPYCTSPLGGGVQWPKPSHPLSEKLTHLSCPCGGPSRG